MSVAHRTVALDSGYNSYRPIPNQHRMLYIRRRNQILQDNAKRLDNMDIREQYLKRRLMVLASKYGPLDRKSRSGSSHKGSSRHSLHQSMESLPLVDSLSTPQRVHSGSFLSTGVVPTRSANASRALAGDSTLAEYYAFCGMHHIFDKHSDAITAVRFANDDKTLLISCSKDGTLSIFSLLSDPPSLLHTLRGHTSSINDFDWSVANDFIVSASSDGTCRLWEAASGRCVREIPDSALKVLCCRFHPQNNNLLVIGNNKAQVKVFNVSTGKAVKGGSSKTAGSVLCLTFEPTGSHLWAGDSKGSVYSFQMDKISWKLTRNKRVVVSPGCGLTCISYRTWVNREARDPSLLVSCGDGLLRLFRILPDGAVYLKRKFPVPQTSHHLRSAFCPLMSFLQGACVVSGGEDGNVYFFDVESGVLVNKLQGHSSPALCICWTYDESFLASCDADGTIIVWKREQKQKGSSNDHTPKLPSRHDEL